MYFVGVLCLLSAAVALPTPEQLHTNLPALPPPPQLKSDSSQEEVASVDRVILDPPVPIPEIAIEEPDKSDESKNLLQSAEKSKEENDKAQDKPDHIKVIQKDSKESKDSKDSKEKSKESKESKEDDPMGIRPDEPQEEKKEKDSKSEESKERFEEDVPVIVEVIKGPIGIIPDWIKNFFQNINFPTIHWPFSRSEFRNGDQPIYMVKESDLNFD